MNFHFSPPIGFHRDLGTEGTSFKKAVCPTAVPGYVSIANSGCSQRRLYSKDTGLTVEGEYQAGNSDDTRAPGV